MNGWRSEAPASPAALRDALYGGTVFQLPPTEASGAIVRLAQQTLETIVDPTPREAFAKLAPDALFARLGEVRRTLYLSTSMHALLFELLRELGQDPRQWAIDPARLRVVHPRGEQNPAAAAVYAVHRDTWYGHPPGLVTWWIPLDDLPQEETFVVWPDALRRVVPNDSEVFDYDAWVAQGWSLKVGWQDPEAGRTARYPAYLGDRDALGPGVGFDCRAGENLLFSGAHLHGTRPHDGARTRFSLDLRLVHLPDHADGRGAPSVDARGRGSAVADYLRWDTTGWGTLA